MKSCNMDMQYQPVISIGTIGGVTNGKSSIVKAITGEATQRHSKEQKSNATLRLGYGNAKIYKCKVCAPPQCYQSTDSSVMEHGCRICGNDTELKTHISFADCPGHASLMSTMLNGTCIMDYAILVESVTNDQIPASQTIEHFAVANEAKIPIPLICLNKLDLMLKRKNDVLNIIDKINKFVASNGLSKIPILPISGSMGYNIDILCEYLAKLPIPEKDTTGECRMLIVRSFNINKEKIPISDINGGVVGGTLLKGILNMNDDVTIYPGYIVESGYTPLQGKVKSIRSDRNELGHAIPGGSIAVQLDIDSAFTGDNKIVGQVVYNSKKTDVKVFSEITLKFKSLSKKEFTVGETIEINVNANNLSATVGKIDEQMIELKLEKPICLEVGDRVSMIRHNNRIDICGYGTFVCGVEFPMSGGLYQQQNSNK